MRAGRASIAFVFVAACGPAIPPLPGRGGPAWLEVATEHFTLWTDASAERGRELVRDMERRRQVIMTAMNHAPSKARAFVIALRNAREVAAYLPGQFLASAWDAHNPTGQPGILLAANNDDDAQVVNHELAHVISYEIIKDRPAWLAEGIATYFETDLDSDDASVQIGIPRQDRARLLRDCTPRSVAKLFACSEDACKDHTFYATSWALFSFLLNERYDQLAGYFQRLNDVAERLQRDTDDVFPELSPDAPARRHLRARAQALRAEAWHEAFPDLPPATLDRALSDWLATGKLRLPKIDVTVHDVPAIERPLGDADVLAARSVLALQVKQDVAAARGNAEAALAIDRTHVLARLIEAAITHAIAPDDARATAASHPEDWRAWRLMARALEGSPEGDAARVRLCELAANEAPECTGAGGERGVPSGSSR